MSDILFKLIKDSVYKDKEIMDISFNSSGKIKNWIFDFKSQGLSKIFLQEYSRYFWESFSGKEYENIQIGGMESGAISLITGVSLLSSPSKKVNSFYIRKSRKKSDLANLVEGDILRDVPIVLVDDILNGGITIRKQIKILEDMRHKVCAVFVCLRFRDLAYYKDLTDKGIKIISIFELNDFSRVLPVENIISDNVISNVSNYKIEYKISLTTKPNLYKITSKSSPVLVDKYVYIGADGGYFYCINTENGKVIWRYAIVFGYFGQYIFSSPSVYEDCVIFGAYDGNVYCLDRFTGERKWVFFDGDWVNSSPCVDSKNGIVYIGLEFGLFKKQGGVVAIDIKTGKAKWKNYKISGLVKASPNYNRKHNIVVCGSDDNYIYAFNAKTGVVFWRFETKGEIKGGVAFDEKSNFVIFGSMDGGIYVLHSESGKLYHRFEAGFGFCTTPVISGIFIIVGSLDKKVYCFNIITKSTEWIFETRGRIFANPTIDQQSIFIGSNDGVLYELDINNGKVLSSIQLSERIVNGVQVEHLLENKRAIYVSTHVCELYKIIVN